MGIGSDGLKALTAAIFSNTGSGGAEAEAIARHLVEANLVGHDSHGVIRVPAYVQWVGEGKLVPNQSISVAFENDSVAIVDGNSGFGQVIGEQAVDLGIDKCRTSGLAMVGLRNAGHIGRIGDWAIRAADAGLVSIHFVNTSGGGILVAPFGGTDRRLSANPIAAGVPLPGRRPIVVDMSTCVIAEGKIQVARNKKEQLPEGAVLDGKGKPTRDPEKFYADPPGAILPIAGHKGSGLSLICEVLAGALTGGGSTHPDNPTAKRLVNNMLSILIDADSLTGASAFAADVKRLKAWTKASPPIEKGGEVLLPGEIERRTRADCEKNGIPIDDVTRAQIAGAAEAVGLPQRDIDSALA